MDIRDTIINGPGQGGFRSPDWDVRDVVFEHFFRDYGDIDRVEASCNLDVLQPLLGTRCNLGNSGKCDNNWMIIVTSPWHVMISTTGRNGEDHKSLLLQQLSGPPRGYEIRPHEKAIYLASSPITVSTFDLVRHLRAIGVTKCKIRGYGDKASVEAGLEIMKLLRHHDPTCIIHYDAAVSIPAEKSHWALGNNCLPISADGTIQHKVLSLMKMEDLEKAIELGFGEDVKIEHYPMFHFSQLHYDRTGKIPNYGSYTITPRGAGRDIPMMYVQKIKAYSTHTHDQKHLTAYDIGDRITTTRVAKLRLATLMKWVQIMMRSIPKIRFEACCKLPRVFNDNTWPVLDNGRPNILEIFDSPIRAIALAWSNTQFVHLPLYLVKVNMEMIEDYVRNVPMRAPAISRAFCCRDMTDIDPNRKDWIYMVLAAMGVTSTHFNKLFSSSFANVHHWDNSPIQYFFLAVWRHQMKTYGLTSFHNRLYGMNLFPGQEEHPRRIHRSWFEQFPLIRNPTDDVATQWHSTSHFKNEGKFVFNLGNTGRSFLLLVQAGVSCMFEEDFPQNLCHFVYRWRNNDVAMVDINVFGARILNVRSFYPDGDSSSDSSDDDDDVLTDGEMEIQYNDAIGDDDEMNQIAQRVKIFSIGQRFCARSVRPNRVVINKPTAGMVHIAIHKKIVDNVAMFVNWRNTIVLNE
eukprot:scaffold19528_cov70-Cyclotella_meneghiniana.AAC.3